MSISVVNSVPEDEWRQFVDRNPMGNIFHTPEMFAVFQNTKGYQPELWAARDDDKQLLVLFSPVRISVNNGPLRALTTFAVAYGSILCAQCDKASEGLRNLLNAYQKEARSRSVYTELRNCRPMDEYQPLLEQLRFDYEDHLNYIISLDGSPEAVFNNIGKRTQRNIKRGINQGRVTIEEVNDRSGIDTSYELLRKTYHLAQVPLADRSLFEAAYKLLHPKGMLRVTLAKVESTPVATSLELLYKDTIYGWYGGMDRAYGSYNPNELLMWDILRWGSENGYKNYDFGGAGKPDEGYGVRDFKAKFGGSLVCYGRYKWISRPVIFNLSKQLYSVYRRFL